MITISIFTCMLTCSAKIVDAAGNPGKYDRRFKRQHCLPNTNVVRKKIEPTKIECEVKVCGEKLKGFVYQVLPDDHVDLRIGGIQRITHIEDTNIEWLGVDNMSCLRNKLNSKMLDDMPDREQRRKQRLLVHYYKQRCRLEEPLHCDVYSKSLKAWHTGVVYGVIRTQSGLYVHVQYETKIGSMEKTVHYEDWEQILWHLREGEVYDKLLIMLDGPKQQCADKPIKCVVTYAFKKYSAEVIKRVSETHVKVRLTETGKTLNVAIECPHKVKWDCVHYPDDEDEKIDYSPISEMIEKTFGEWKKACVSFV